MQKLRVLPRGGVLVPRHETIMRRRSGEPVEFVGRKAEIDADAGVVRHPACVTPDAPAEVPSIPASSAEHWEIWQQYARELRDGALWPADEATAKAAGCAFDSKFGGEFSSSSTED